MPDYNHLLDRCRYVNKISASLIDEFLVYYAARHDKVEREFETRISRFRDIEKEMPSNWKGLIKAQYIGQRIFKEGGLIHKYLNSAAIKARNAEEQEHLRIMAAYPWRFSFSEIRANRAPDFYEMEDVFTGDIFLLYSPSITRTLSDQPVLLWFNLIGYNGSCWQTYGPVISFQSFCSDDIFFYATELNPAIESDADLMADLDDNPVRYMVLACGSTYPLVVQQDYEVVQVTGEGTYTGFDVQVPPNPIFVYTFPWVLLLKRRSNERRILIHTASYLKHEHLLKARSKCRSSTDSWPLHFLTSIQGGNLT